MLIGSAALAVLALAQSTSTSACGSLLSPSGIASRSWQRCLRQTAATLGEPVPFFGAFVTGPEPAAELERETPRLSQAQLRQLARCAADSLRGRSPPLGRITLEALLDQDGKVSKVEVVEDSLHDATISRCVTALLARWTLGAGPQRRLVLPLVFSPPADYELRASAPAR